MIVPLILRSQGIGIFIIHTEKPQQEFSNQDIQLLSVLANQAAVGVENWRTYQQLLKANEELKASQAQMVQAAKLAAIGELAAGIAHEIKNPLQVLMLHLELVQAGRPLPNWIEMFSKQLKRLSDITLRLMNFARNVSEEVATEPININKAIEDIVMMVQHEFEGNGINMELQLADDLPCVGGNANYLQQVFLNLLINARDAMPEGGTITVATSLTGFHVSDPHRRQRERHSEGTAGEDLQAVLQHQGGQGHRARSGHLQQDHCTAQRRNQSGERSGQRNDVHDLSAGLEGTLMNRRWTMLSVLGIVLWGIIPVPAAESATLTDVRYSAQAGYSRVILLFDGEVRYSPLGSDGVVRLGFSRTGIGIPMKARHQVLRAGHVTGIDVTSLPGRQHGGCIDRTGRSDLPLHSAGIREYPGC